MYPTKLNKTKPKQTHKKLKWFILRHLADLKDCWSLSYCRVDSKERQPREDISISDQLNVSRNDTQHVYDEKVKLFVYIINHFFFSVIMKAICWIGQNHKLEEV